MALADVDGNGTLDLYVANFRVSTVRDQPSTRFSGQVINGRQMIVAVDGRPTTAPDLTNRFAVSPSGEVLEYGEPDVLYRNDGKGRFSQSRSRADRSSTRMASRSPSRRVIGDSPRSFMISPVTERRIYTFATTSSPPTAFGSTTGRERFD